MTTLYQITDTIQAIVETEELTVADEARLAELELDFDAKVEAILQYRQGLLADAAALKAERERLKAREDAMLRRADWLRGYVLRSMQALGLKKTLTKTFSAFVASSPPRVVIAAGAELPERMLREKVTTEPDKTAILEAWGAGAQLPPGVEVVCDHHLRIT